MNLIGQTLDDKYSIERQLGQGGMGAVYLATHIGTGRLVALKVIMPEYMSDSEFVERFRREARAAGRLRHPNVVNVTDFGFAGLSNARIAYLVMEYLDGGTLGDMLKARKQLPLGLAIDITEQVAIAIDEAHKQGIIHRDLKPDNIWLQPDGRGGYNVKVLDFGLAKLYSPNTTKPLAINTGNLSNYIVDMEAITVVNPENIDDQAPTKLNSIKVDPNAQTAIGTEQNRQATTHKNANGEGEAATLIKEAATLITPANSQSDPVELEAATALQHNIDLTQAGRIVGTPIYMSPEQFQGLPLDLRTDIYSLGIIVYQMLTGTPPFRGNLRDLYEQHTKGVPAPLTSKNKQIPSAISELVLTALAKDREQRPPSAGAFASALRANSEGALPILREAFDLYRKHLGPFLQLSILLFVPFLILNYLWITISLSRISLYLPGNLATMLQQGYWLISLLLLLFATSINSAAFVPIVDQLRNSREAKLDILIALKTFFRRHIALLATCLRAILRTLIGFAKLLRPGIKAYQDYALAAAVVMNEDLSGSAALTRSQNLVERLRAPMRSLQARNLYLCLLTLMTAPPLLMLAGLMVSMLNEEKVEFVLSRSGAVPSFITVPVIYSLPVIAFIAVFPFMAIAMALYYFRVCQIGGERGSLRDNFQSIPARELPIIDYRPRVLLAAILIAALSWFAIKDSLLAFAANGGLSNMVEALIITGANANSTIRPELLGEFRTTPLIQAVSSGNEEIVRLLLDHGAKTNVANQYNWTPLMEAVLQKNMDLIKMLVESGADVNAISNPSRTVLMTAINTGDLAIVEYLLEHGARVDHVNGAGENALMLAVIGGQAYMIKPLLDKGADISIKDNLERDCLSYAAAGGDSYIVKLLLENGAKKDSRDSNNLTPLDYAKGNGHADIVKLLAEEKEE